ncbi:hypothetical protein COCSUDRAFT_41892 [Coccomyxa subellipsoidea C-169]|uniref:Expansin-like EG45 domain-containing protein n=1 Tax=Coccomyxa subellipsoidea (strain C-169) TaxID=574566 RepID=I0YZB3_COCSC|nr:hypothetical protein COCSUDRAFT_41892 [Coccomyxa subellipsoidea C-169]EIE23732.1 hypothetical protein COCSUDRAFT_41892 [Coccomyxa subellipsoidea C-169]|eukprot:XP_005648276.1 hypothetical protein COCSUDRAFT_41892 [Coccomyxa subellipsoidea C-169]
MGASRQGSRFMFMCCVCASRLQPGFLMFYTCLLHGFASFTKGVTPVQDGVDPSQPSGALLRGSCGYGAFSRKTWPFWSVATASASNFALLGKGSSGCGACLQKCAQRQQNSAQPVVFVGDICTSCAPGQISVHAAFFNDSIGDPSSGTLPVQFRQVECQPPRGMVMRVTDYSVSGDGSIRVVPTQVAGTGTLDSVELRASAGEGVSDRAHAWRPMNNSFGAAWELSDLYPPPFDLRLRDNVGRTVIVNNAIPEPAVGDYATDAQFSTADRPGGSSEVAQGTPLLPQPGSALAPAPAPMQDGASGDPSIQPFEMAHRPPLVGLVRTPSPAPQLIQLPFSNFVIPNATGLTSFLMNGNTSQTVFAPTNSAWKGQPDTRSSRALTNLMLFHMALGNRDVSSFHTVAAAGGQDSKLDYSGAVPMDTLQGNSVYIRPNADKGGLLVGDSARAAGTPTNFAQATCSGSVYGLDIVLSPPT